MKQDIVNYNIKNNKWTKKTYILSNIYTRMQGKNIKQPWNIIKPARMDS